MLSPRKASDQNILNSGSQETIVSTGSPRVQSSVAQEGLDEDAKTIDAHENHVSTSDLSQSSEKTVSGLEDWKKYHGDAASGYSSSSLPSQTSKAQEIKQSERKDDTDTPEDYPQGLQLALIILGVCLSVFIIALNRQIVSTVCLKTPPPPFLQVDLILTRLFLVSLTSSAPTKMSVGTVARICSQLALFNHCTDAYSCHSTSSSPTSSLSSSSRRAPSFVVSHRIRPSLSLDGPFRDLAALV